MEREQIIKAWEDEVALGKDIGLTRDFINYVSINLVNNTLSLIKELTEELADLQAIAKQYQNQFEDCYEEKQKLTEENERLHESYTKVARNLHECKADTARKIQERLRSEKFHHMNFGDLVYLEDIDRISKELLED